MSKPLTHRARAESAADAIHPYAVPEWRSKATEVVARETYPDELVAAARLLMNGEHFYDCLAGQRGRASGEDCSRACQVLRAALALYEDHP